MMKLKALDRIHISALKPDMLDAGDEFEIENGAGQSLVDRGLATVVKTAPPAEKAAPPPENKMARAPANKAGPRA